MKSNIRKILKESNTDNYIRIVLDKIQKDIKSGNLSTPHTYRQKFAIGENETRSIRNIVVEKLNHIQNKTIDINEYELVYGTGGYDFNFIIHKYDDTQLGLDNIITLSVIANGEVEILSDNEVYDINDAINEFEWGWEVKAEITDIINGILSEHLIIEMNLSMIDIVVNFYS